MSATTETDIRELAAEVRYLRDRLAILDCVNRYTRGLDRLDAELIASAFHPDAIDHHGAYVGRIPEFVRWAIEVEAQYGATSHHTTCHHCDIDGDVATTESYVLWLVTAPSGDSVSSGSGRYLDRFERRGGEWRIAYRTLLLDLRFSTDASIVKTNPLWFPTGTRDRHDLSYARPLPTPPEHAQAAQGGQDEGATRATSGHEGDER